MTKTFNLIDEPWVPCIDKQGNAKELSLTETFAQAHQLATLQGDSPLQTGALHRFLLAILHRVFGPEDDEEWLELWQAESFAMTPIKEYLAKWHHRFDLFAEEYPFYQAQDSRMKLKSTISLSHDRASGNNATLFDHHTEEVGEILTPAQATRTLITAQAYGLAGLSGITQKFTDGTCAGGILFLIEGNTLKETLMLNLIQYPARSFKEYFKGEQSADDKPAWEMDDPFILKRPYTSGYLDYLTWQNRRVLFKQDEDNDLIGQMTMGPALGLDMMTVLDPMKLYRPDKKLGHVAISFNEDKVFWRDSATLLTFHDDFKDHYRPPMTLHWIKLLVDNDILPKHYQYRLMALGMSKKQAKVNFFRAEHLPLPLAYLSDDNLVGRLQESLKRSDDVAFALVSALRRTGTFLYVADANQDTRWKNINRNTKADINTWIDHTGAIRRFWSRLTVPFQKLIIYLPKDEISAIQTWHEILRTSAKTVFESAEEYVGKDGRSFKALANGQRSLNIQLRKLFPKQENQNGK